MQATLGQRIQQFRYIVLGGLAVLALIAAAVLIVEGLGLRRPVFTQEASVTASGSRPLAAPNGVAGAADRAASGTRRDGYALTLNSDIAAARQTTAAANTAWGARYAGQAIASSTSRRDPYALTLNSDVAAARQTTAAANAAWGARYAGQDLRPASAPDAGLRAALYGQTIAADGMPAGDAAAWNAVTAGWDRLAAPAPDAGERVTLAGQMLGSTGSSALAPDGQTIGADGMAAGDAAAWNAVAAGSVLLPASAPRDR